MRVGCALIILQVASDARRAIQAVIVVDVAIGALPRGYGVRSAQREARVGVIEGRIRPVRRVVAGVAGLREVGGDVIRIRRALVVLQMASYAGSAIQSVVVVDVAIGALPRRHGVRTGQGKTG